MRGPEKMPSEKLSLQLDPNVYLISIMITIKMCFPNGPKNFTFNKSKLPELKIIDLIISHNELRYNIGYVHMVFIKYIFGSGVPAS